jgi:dihydropteroate synthase
MRPVFYWNLGSRSLELGKRTLIMGILNVTPDSFSDGGEFFDGDRALKHGLRLLEEGADIVDIGGESTRPGARVEAASENSGSTEEPQTKRLAVAAVSAEEEVRRVIPVIAGLKKEYPAAVISVDTYKAAVARAAVEAGAEIVNDVSGFRWDAHMLNTLADLRCGAVLMHMRGRPEQWRNLPPPEDVVSLVKGELERSAEATVSAGVDRRRIVLDLGFGFGKSFDENYPLIAHFDDLHGLGFPLLAGTSRKSFLGRTMSGESVAGEKKIPPPERLFGTLASETALILKGTHVIRTHDVKASLQAARVADAILQGN